MFHSGPSDTGRRVSRPSAQGDAMRVALLTYKGNPFSGGQGVYVRNLSRELAALGHRVEVLAGQPYPQLDEGVRFTALPSLDLYRQPDPFRTPGLREYRDAIDLLEVSGSGKRAHHIMPTSSRSIPSRNSPRRGVRNGSGCR